MLSCVCVCVCVGAFAGAVGVPVFHAGLSFVVGCRWVCLLVVYLVSFRPVWSSLFFCLFACLFACGALVMVENRCAAMLWPVRDSS